jgi:hypothetical protein
MPKHGYQSPSPPPPEIPATASLLNRMASIAGAEYLARRTIASRRASSTSLSLGLVERLAGLSSRSVRIQAPFPVAAPPALVAGWINGLACATGIPGVKIARIEFFGQPSVPIATSAEYELCSLKSARLGPRPLSASAPSSVMKLMLDRIACGPASLRRIGGYRFRGDQSAGTPAILQPGAVHTRGLLWVILPRLPQCNVGDPVLLHQQTLPLAAGSSTCLPQRPAPRPKPSSRA